MLKQMLVTCALLCGVLGSHPAYAGEKKAAVNPAVEANNDFACDLYRNLSAENQGKNLFFSPYSISSALAMTLEGARGQTAQEMGKVLRLPESLRADAADMPWKTAPYHLGFNELNRRLNERPEELKVQALRQKLADLRAQLAKVNAQVATLQKQGKFKEVVALQTESRKLADAVNALSQQVDQYEMRVANAVWAEKTYPFKRDYFDAISKYYGSDTLRNADFRGDFKGERAKINGWVEKQTKDRIKDLIPDYPPAFAQRIQMILVNAIFFKGQWATPFDAKLTKKEAFLLSGGGKAQADLMHLQDHRQARYAAFNGDGSAFVTPASIPFQGAEKVQTYPDKDGFLVAELPIRGEKISMVVLAPQRPDGLPALEAKLTGAKLSAWIAELKKRPVNVALPKFKLETDYSLGATLQKMGMKLAFEERKADFTAMSDSSNPDDRLSIGAVLHKAFVEVNEKGAEAAAATAVIMVTPTSIPVSTPFTPTFRADRPFLFLLRDTQSGAVLFLGRMTQPG